jgi:hypothetical protein
VIELRNMKINTLTPELFRLPGDMVFILAGVVPAVLAAATAWRFRNKSAGATANPPARSYPHLAYGAERNEPMETKNYTTSCRVAE